MTHDHQLVAPESQEPAGKREDEAGGARPTPNRSQAPIDFDPTNYEGDYRSLDDN